MYGIIYLSCLPSAYSCIGRTDKWDSDKNTRARTRDKLRFLWDRWRLWNVFRRLQSPLHLCKEIHCWASFLNEKRTDRKWTSSLSGKNFPSPHQATCLIGVLEVKTYKYSTALSIRTSHRHMPPVSTFLQRVRVMGRERVCSPDGACQISHGSRVNITVILCFEAQRTPFV